jgi:hypothetical protein
MLDVTCCRILAYINVGGQRETHFLIRPCRQSRMDF